MTNTKGAVGCLIFYNEIGIKDMSKDNDNVSEVFPRHWCCARLKRKAWQGRVGEWYFWRCKDKLPNDGWKTSLTTPTRGDSDGRIETV
jgi:hypothetical protein